MNAWPAVIGTLGGVVLGGVIAHLNERYRWRKSEEGRWLDERLRLYAQFLAACTEVVRVGSLQAMLGGDKAYDWEPTNLWMQEYDRVSRALMAADEAVRGTNAQIELVGGDGEILAAARLRDSAWGLNAANSLRPSSEPSAVERERKLTAAVKEWDEAQIAFKAAARTGIHPAGLNRP